MIFYSILWNGQGYGVTTYVLPHQIGREHYYAEDRSWWLIPGTFDLNA